MATYRAAGVYNQSKDGEGANHERVVPLRTASRLTVGLEEHKHLRAATPADRPLPRTLKWAASLPLDVQPTALLRHFGRVANVIAATWGHTTSLRSYMDCLFNDKRGNRQGFPPQVLDELVALKRHHDAMQTRASPDKPGR